MWPAKSDPTDCVGVDCPYTTGPPPVYLGSSPYSKCTCVASPFGVTDPENPALVTLTVGAVVATVGGDGVVGGGEFGAGVVAACTTAVGSRSAGWTHCRWLR